MSLFAIQHSVMARKSFKHWWTQFIPRSVERSTYALCASLTLLLLFWQWRRCRPSSARPGARYGRGDRHVVVHWLGDRVHQHLPDQSFELFGLHQVANNLVGTRDAGRPSSERRSSTVLVRHPIYLGFIIAFWAAPTMSAGHLLFAAVTTAYIFVASCSKSAISSACSAMNIAVIGSAFPCYSPGAGRSDPLRTYL